MARRVNPALKGAIDKIEDKAAEWRKSHSGTLYVVLVRDSELTPARLSSLAEGSSKHDHTAVVIVIPSVQSAIVTRILSLRCIGFEALRWVDFVFLCEESSLSHVLRALAPSETSSWVDADSEEETNGVNPYATALVCEEPFPLAFVKISGRTAMPVDDNGLSNFTLMAKELAGVQQKNLVLFLGSSRCAGDLAEELMVSRLPEWINTPFDDALLKRYQSRLWNCVVLASELLWSSGVPAVPLMAQDIAHLSGGQCVVDAMSVGGILHIGGVPIIVGGLVPEKTRCLLPSVDEIAANIAEHLCPDSVIISTCVDGILDENGRLVRKLSQSMDIVDLVPDSVTPGIPASLDFYRRLAASSLSVHIVNAEHPTRVATALQGGDVEGTVVLGERPSSIPVARAGYSTIYSHQELLADRRRVQAFRKAMKKNGLVGKRVLDFGTGTGILACLAADSGADYVAAVERDQIVEAADALRQCSPHAAKMKMVRGSDLGALQGADDEKFDVLLSETIGSFGLNTHALEELWKLRDRYLRKDGSMIPSRLQLWLAPGWSPSTGARVAFWNRWYCRWPLAGLATLTANQPYVTWISSTWVASEQQMVAEYSMNTERSLDFSWAGRFSLERGLAASGPHYVNCLIGWVLIELAENIVLDTGPSAFPTSWYHVVFPLERPLSIADAPYIDARLTFKQQPIMHEWNWCVSADNGKGLVYKCEHAGEMSFPVRPQLTSDSVYPALDWLVWRT